MGSSRPATRCERNWAYNTLKRGYRYDRVNDPKSSSSAAYGILYGNIGWNTSATFVKGDWHNVTGNLHFLPVHGETPDDPTGKGVMDLIVLGPGETPYAFDFENTHTTVDRNGGQAMGCGSRNHSFAGPAANNVEADVTKQLRDVANFDFRPLAGSEFAKANVGPYSASGNYWIPGRQQHAASHPIPADGAVGVAPTTDLMFRHSFGAESHQVLFAEEGLDFVELPLANGGNIVAPSLHPGIKYHWRVVSRHSSHEAFSPIWTFTTESYGSILV